MSKHKPKPDPKPEHDPKHNKDHDNVDINVDIDTHDVPKSDQKAQTFDYNYDYDADVDVDTSKTNIDVDVKTDKAHVTIVKKDIDIDENYNSETWTTTVDVHADSIVQGGDYTLHSDNDVNDLDAQSLLNNTADLTMEDFSFDQVAIGNSFNGAGNDGHIKGDQSNNLNDEDDVSGTTATYNNDQKPNIDAKLKVEGTHDAESKGKWQEDWKSDEKYDEKTVDWKGKSYTDREGDIHSNGWGHGSWHQTTTATAKVTADLDIKAPETAFQTAYADGGKATAGDGISDAGGWGLASENEGDGTISGDSSASADGVATAEAFTAEVIAGQNQQANFSTLEITGGNQLNAGDIAKDFEAESHGGKWGSNAADKNGDGDAKEGGLAIKDAWVTENLDDDVNDFDSQDLLLNHGTLNMEDFEVDTVGIGNSFNGPGNDYALDWQQANDLADADVVTGTTSTYNGTGWNGPFQDVTAYGGNGTSGDGIGKIDVDTAAYGNGGDGTIAGSTAATGDALASATAFTSSVVVGANVQVNNFSASVVGGDNAIVDDIGGDAII